MAEIAPFRGIVYDTARVAAADVLAPPYDVIDADQRAALAARSPWNSVRLILPEGEGDARYGVAAALLAELQAKAILRRDPVPALYRYHQRFTSAELGPEPVTRRGFIAAVRLHRFDERVILPHERTLSGPKVDRLKLMRATRAHFSQIFTLYSDPAGVVDRAFAAAEQAAPTLEGTTADGTTHRMWRVSAAEPIAAVVRALAPLSLYIADGHHRYETMLTLRDELAAEAGELAPRSAARFGTLFLANMDDPGLVVLPTHRLLFGLAGFSAERLLAAVAPFFEVTVRAGAAAQPEVIRQALAAAPRPSFTAIFPGRADAVQLTLRADFDPAAAGLTGSPAVTALDVSLLHDLVLERLLGVDRAAQAAQQHLEYFKDTGKALAAVAAGKGQVLFVMNPTRVAQVRAVADVGEIMPQKSTFFFPKIASGIVINPIAADEIL